MSVTELFKQDDTPEDRTLQCDSRGNLRHLLTLDGLNAEQITALLDRAETYLTPMGERAARNDVLAGVTVANLFFEPSTRTKASFELAAKRLGADVLNLDVNTSSRRKGESILDTLYTLQAMQIDVFVVRDAIDGVPGYIVRHADDHVSVLNAGEANISHPTQGLLDLLTIRQYKPDFANLSIAIVGDIEHSRVARSAAQGLRALGTEDIRLVAPKALAPDLEVFPGCRLHHDMNSGLAGVDIVMALRIQRERIGSLDGIPGIDEYHATFGVTRERMKAAKADAIVMHPGPMNRGVEIESALADAETSVITQQVTNGVAVRMAVLQTVCENQGMI